MNFRQRLLVPYTRGEFYRFEELMQWAGVGWTAGNIPAWKSNTIIRGKQHGYLMRLDCSDWCQRLTYYLGRYYELAVLKTMDALLRPGDHFVDIGANIGMLTLHARHLVGATGRIDAFEPNPVCQAAITEHLRMNNIDNVVLHPCALSDVPGQMTLHMTSEHSGTATLTAVTGGSNNITVDVMLGDDELQGSPRLIKIDVEGFELHVLRGVQQTLYNTPFVLMELIEGHLKRAGTSVTEIAAFMQTRGYKPYGLSSSRRRRFLPERLVLHAINGPFDRFTDVLWARVTLPPSLALTVAS